MQKWVRTEIEKESVMLRGRTTENNPRSMGRTAREIYDIIKLIFNIVRSFKEENVCNFSKSHQKKWRRQLIWTKGDFFFVYWRWKIFSINLVEKTNKLRPEIIWGGYWWQCPSGIWNENCLSVYIKSLSICVCSIHHIKYRENGSKVMGKPVHFESMARRIDLFSIYSY